MSNSIQICWRGGIWPRMPFLPCLSFCQKVARGKWRENRTRMEMRTVKKASSKMDHQSNSSLLYILEWNFYSKIGLRCLSIPQSLFSTRLCATFERLHFTHSDRQCWNRANKHAREKNLRNAGCVRFPGFQSGNRLTVLLNQRVYNLFYSISWRVVPPLSGQEFSPAISLDFSVKLAISLLCFEPLFVCAHFYVRIIYCQLLRSCHSEAHEKKLLKESFPPFFFERRTN